MKKIKKTVVVLMLLALAASNGFAQRGNMEPEEKARFQTERQKTMLALSDSQTVALEKINLDRAKKVQEMRAGMQGQRVKNRLEMITVQEEYDSQVLAILDEEQKAKFLELRENRKSKMNDKRMNGKRRDNYPRNRNSN